jgi:predicted permease
MNFRLWRRERRDEELDAEIESHLNMAAREHLERGETPQQARDSARREIGNVGLVKEATREAWGRRWLRDAGQDVSYALRRLRRSPGFTVVAILTLALGIGANTAIFTLINTVMLTRLPVGHPEQLVLLHWMSHSRGPFVWQSMSSVPGCGTNDPGTGDTNCSFSFPDYENFRAHAQSLQGIVAYGGDVIAQLEMNGRATRAIGQYVSGDFFPVLETRPALGRLLEPADDLPGAPAALVLEYNYWRTQFNRDPQVIGQTVLLNGVPFTITGVATLEFYGLAPGSRPAFWVALHAHDRLTDPVRINPDQFNARAVWIEVVGRVKTGVAVERARVELETIFRGSLASEATAAAKSPSEYEQTHPHGAFDTNLGISLTSVEHGVDTLRGTYSNQLFILMGAAGLVLLIACANIANLLLGRASARRKEIAVRLALGASRGRLVRQLLTESVLLAFLGCAAGLLVSAWASIGLVYVLISSRASASLLASFQPDYRVYGFAAGVAVIAAILFGLAPAFACTRVSQGDTLKGAGATADSGPSSFGRNLMGRGLVAGEMALALVLVIAAGLFLRTLIALETIDPGFRTDHVLSFYLSPLSAKIPADKIPALGQELQRRITALPGVQSVTWSGFTLASGGLMMGLVKIQEHPDLGEVGTQFVDIGPGYFETLKIPVLAGRSITVEDCRKGFQGVWIDRGFANKYLKNANALGTHLVRGKSSLEVLGVVGDVRVQSVKSDFKPTVYRAMPGGDFSFEIRTANNPKSLENPVRMIVSDVAPNLPVSGMQTLQEAIDNNLSQENSMARLSSALGLLALVLAAIGIYGVLAYSVSRRTNEIAIRISLGAMRRDILRLVLKEGLAPAAVGAAIGLLAAWGLTWLIATFLYQVKPFDPATFLVATVVLLAIAALACYVPARRATKVDPMVALRYE